MSKTVKLTEIETGKAFTADGIEFIKFSEENGETVAVTKNIVFRSRFGDNNDLRNSDVLKKMNADFIPKLVEAVGDEKICEFETDLTITEQYKNEVCIKAEEYLRRFIEICNDGSGDLSSFNFYSEEDKIKAQKVADDIIAECFAKMEAELK